MQDPWFSIFPLARRCMAAAGVVLCLAATPAQAKFGDRLYKLTSPDPVVGGGFGYSVGISGDIAIVSRGYYPQNPDVVTYLFDTTTGQELRRLTPSYDGATGGLAWVAISGNVALSSMGGSVYQFDTTTGQELRKLTPSDEAPYSPQVAISGNIAVVGNWDWRAPYTGSAYLFDVTTGQQLFKLTASDAAVGDGFGDGEVAISGNTAIVSGRGAYLFDVTTGQELFKLTASDVAAEDGFGTFVAISGSTAIVGANIDDDAGTNSGAAYLFDVSTGQELFKLTASDAAAGDAFGTTVAISGNTAIVGAVGKAYLFDVTTGQELMKLRPDPVRASYIVAIDGDTAIIGVPGSGYVPDLTQGSGAAYVFDVSRNLAISGDFNNDGTVDAADYIVWRNGLGSTYTQADYNFWRANFGQTAASGATAGLPSSVNPAVPEPISVLLLVPLGLLLVYSARHWRTIN